MSDINQNPMVLCIENEPSIQSFLERILRKRFSVSVMFVATGEEAIRVLESRTDWTLVISDWTLDGGMDGGNVLDWVISHAPDLLDHYIFLSSHDEAERVTMKVGVPLLRKPCGLNDICDAINPFFRTSVA